jgi:hypothetical protein
MTVDELVSKGFAASEMLDAGVSCDDVERQYGEQKAECGNNTRLIVVIVVVVVLVVAVAGVALFVHRHKGTGQRRDGDQAHPRITAAQYHTATKMTANQTFDLTGPLGEDQSKRRGRLQSNVFVAGTGVFLVPMEGSVDSPGFRPVYSDPASRQSAPSDAPDRSHQSQATPYAQPWADAQPTYAEPIASTNSMQVYADVNGNEIPTFVEHIDGGYSQVRGGQVYADAADGVSPQECDLIYAREMGAAAETCPTPTGHHHDDMYISVTSLADATGLNDRPDAALSASSAGVARGRLNTDRNSSNEQPTTAKLASNSSCADGGKGGIKRTARKGSVYAGFADGDAAEASSA